MDKETSNTISLKDLTIGYPGSPELLSGINAGVLQGEMLALIGKNGSGKSTLLRTIAGLRKQTAGEVHIGERVNSSIPANEFARIMSFVESGNSTFENLTVYEFVSMGRHPYTNWWGRLKGKDHEKILETIHFVGMSSFIGNPVSRLSDGERQRVMIARALAQETDILLLDEPTAFLDLPNKFEIISVLHKLRGEGKSIIYSTHDLETAFLFADKCWVIHERNLIEGGVEDLGINQVFKEIFKNSAVQFDEKEMKFIPRRIAGRGIYVETDDPTLLKWTLRALERLGYLAANVKSKDNPEIRIEKTGAVAVWKVSYRGNTFNFISLYDMAHYLSKIK